MDKQLIKKYGKTKLIQILKELQPHLNRKQQELNKGYLRKMQFGANTFAIRDGFESLFSIDTCHDFRDGSRSKGKKSKKSRKGGEQNTPPAKPAPPPFIKPINFQCLTEDRSVISYLQFLDTNNTFVNNLNEIPNTEPSGRTDKSFLGLKDIMAPEEPKRSNIINYWNHTNNYRTKDGTVRAVTGEELTGVPIHTTLFSIHDSNPTNGKISDLIRDINSKTASSKPLDSEIKSINYQDFDTPIATVITSIKINVTNNTLITCDYDGDDSFFSQCQIHSNMTGITEGLLNNRLIGLLPNGREHTTIRALTDNVQITLDSKQGNNPPKYILHHKGCGPPMHVLSAIIIILCNARQQNVNFGDESLMARDNIKFVRNIMSIFDIKRLGDYGQNFNTFKKAKNSEDTNKAYIHQANDFWCGIHFARLKRQLTSPPTAAEFAKAYTIYSGSKASGGYTKQVFRTFFGASSSLPLPLPSPETPASPSQNRKCVIQVYTPSFEIQEEEGGGYTIWNGYSTTDDAWNRIQINLNDNIWDTDEMKQQVLKEYGLWRLDKTQKEQETPVITQTMNAYFSMEPYDDTIYIYPGGSYEGMEVWESPFDAESEDEEDAASDDEDYEDSDEGFYYTILKVTRAPPTTSQSPESAPTKGGLFSPMEQESPQYEEKGRGGGAHPRVYQFGKKQKRWVADLKGKKKFVRRQVFSMRKDLVTPSYFEKMTGADFWKLPETATGLFGTFLRY